MTLVVRTKGSSAETIVGRFGDTHKDVREMTAVAQKYASEGYGVLARDGDPAQPSDLWIYRLVTNNWQIRI